MNVPLIVDATNTKLYVTSNGKLTSVSFPFNPYLIAERKPRDLSCETITKTRIPDGIPAQMYKVSSPELHLHSSLSKQIKSEGIHFFSQGYLEQLYTDQEDFVLKYPNTADLKIMYLDIEVLTTGSGIFPRAKTNPIIAIGVADGDNPVQIFDTVGEGQSDKKMLEEFLWHLRETDPDIIVTYNGGGFDLPYIAERMTICGLDPNQMNRYVGELKIEEEEVKFRGRIHFDCILPARKDQTLFGIKNRGLKAVSVWYGHKAIELGDDVENTQAIIGTEKLRTYLRSDVEATRHVCKVYLPNAITLAEMMKVPLNDVVGCAPSFIPKLICSRHCGKLGLVPLESNADRYGKADDEGKIEKPGRLATLGSKYQGAIVDIYKTGYFPWLKKIDFSAQYPSAIITWNLGPDTTRLKSVSEYTGQYSFRRSGTKLILNIPDANFQKNIEVEVETSKVGFLKSELERLATERKRLKSLMKTEQDKGQLASLESQQWAMKIISNSIYGYLGSQYATYGDMITGLTVTAMCRWVSQFVINQIQESIVECDSVTGDTPIYVRRNNEIDIIPIEDLHNSEEERAEYVEDYEIYTRNGWKKILYTKKHKVKKNIHRVKISDGYVDVTSDHSLFDEDKKEIRPSDLVIKSSHIETASFTNNSLIEENEEELEYCWLIGFIIAEGGVCISNGNNQYKCQTSINGNNKDLMEEVKRMCNKYFSIFNTKFELHDTMKSSAVYKVQGGYNYTFCSYLKSLLYCGDWKTKKVPTFILNGSSSMKRSFLDGLYAGDGHIDIHSGRKVSSIDSKFKPLAAGIQYLLHSLGVKTTCSVRKDKRNITTIKERFSYPSGKFREIDSTIVQQNDIISSSDIVYDVSTEDGTFVTSLGNIVLHNTDGYIIFKDVDEKLIEESVSKEIELHTQCRSVFKLEAEAIKDGFFHKMKNYILRKEKKGKLVIEKHGVAFKSSKQAPIIDRVIDVMIQKTLDRELENQYEVAEGLRDFSKCKLTDFRSRQTFTKPLSGYGVGLSLPRALGVQVEDRLKIKVENNLQVEYYVTKAPPSCKPLLKLYSEKIDAKGKATPKVKGPFYSISQYVTSIQQLDQEYYRDQIDKILEVFGWQASPQLTMEL